MSIVKPLLYWIQIYQLCDVLAIYAIYFKHFIFFVLYLGGHHSISGGGGDWSFLEKNNFGQTLRERYNLCQEVFYINRQ